MKSPWSPLLTALMAATLLIAGCRCSSDPPPPPTTIRDLVSLLWLISETAQPFASIVDDARIDSQCYGRAIIEPHLTEAGRRALHLPTSADADGDHP